MCLLTTPVTAEQSVQSSTGIPSAEDIVDLASLPQAAPDKADETGLEFNYELDPYYTNVALFLPLTQEAIRDVGEVSEITLYRVLALESFSPRFFMIEASINPLPILGTYIREKHPDFYADADSGDINLVQALTEGFEDPYALSFFLGNVINFADPQGEVDSANKGYTGFLLSIGDQHIKNNQLIDDRWLEYEWKIKGDRRFKHRSLSWSFRIGGKSHQHPEIADVYHVAIRREHFNKDESDDTFFGNTGIEYKMSFNQDNGDLTEQQLFIDKKWPFQDTDGAFSLGIGIIIERNKYSGSLIEPEIDQEVRLMIRPSFSF